MKLYHISEEAGIEIFLPRPSPQNYENINGDVVFAVNDTMIHNYLLPRDCPRVTFYSKPGSLKSDVDRFIGQSKRKYIITVEDSWLEKIKQTTLYLYELPKENFTLLDEGAGYYISYNIVKPISISPVKNLFHELALRDAELRSIPSLHMLSDEISKSTLQFSIIRMRNATR